MFHEHRVHMRPDCDPAARGLHAQALVQVWIEFDGLGFSLHQDGGLQTRRESASTKFRNNVLTPAAAPCERRGRMKIEKGIPIPAGRCRAYPFASMEVGDSFELPLSQTQIVSSSAYGFGQRHGMKFKLRRTDTNTARIWRTA